MSLRLKVQEVSSIVLALWCTICQIGGKHAKDNYHLLQKYIEFAIVVLLYGTQ